MNELLRFISDLRVVIAIAIIVAILLIWLIIHKVKTNRFRNELQELESQYNLLKGIPVSLKMNKAVAMSKVDEESLEKVKLAQGDFDNVQNDIAKITADLSEAEDLIEAGKMSKADTLMKDIENEVKLTTKSAKDLEAYLDELLAKETAQRQEVNDFKSRFRSLKNKAQDNASALAFTWPIVEQKVYDTEKMFSTFEEWMYSNDFDKANNVLESIRGNLGELENMLDNLPELIQDAKGVIPNMANNLHKNYVDARTKDVYLKHLNIEDNLTVMTESLKEDIKKMKSGSTDGVKEHLDDYKERISQLTEAVTNETEAKDSIDVLLEESENVTKEKKKNLEYVNTGYAKHSERFGLGDMNESINSENGEYEVLKTKKEELATSLNITDKPSSAKLQELKLFNKELNDLSKNILETRTKIEMATGDEMRAKKQLLKLQAVINTMKVKLRKFRLPNISEKYEEDMNVANDYIYKLQGLMDETPLNMQLLNSTLSEALNYIYKLYNEVNNVVGTAQMVEKTIVFGNRYRSTYADIDSQLTRSELSFRNGEYTQALTTAIATIEKIHPGNYESMIKENSKSAI